MAMHGLQVVDFIGLETGLPVAPAVAGRNWPPLLAGRDASATNAVTRCIRGSLTPSLSLQT